MKKTITKIMCIIGDVHVIGIGTLVIYTGSKFIKWGLEELKCDAE